MTIASGGEPEELAWVREWVREAARELIYDPPLAVGEPDPLPQSAPFEPIRIEREGGAFFDLEFCLWLQANFDSIAAQLPQWKEEYERTHAID